MRGTKINSINRSNIEPVKILLSVSCTVFYDYANIPFTIEPDVICEVMNMPAEEGIKKLSQHICSHLLVTMYDDLKEKGNFEMIRELVKKSPLFHIHGRTVRDILYSESELDDPHSQYGRIIFVCTHC